MVKKSLFLIVLLFCGCELFLAPEHTNPFDSRFNAGENGPALSMAVSGGLINLTWTRSQDPDFSQYVIVTSVVRPEIKAAALDPAGYTAFPSVGVLTTSATLTVTNFSLSTAGLTGYHHYAVIYQRTGTSTPKASNIVTYEP